MRGLRNAAQGTSGLILELLRQGPKTVDELARALDLTRTAVRAQLSSLIRDELVEHRESRRGASKPSHVYGVTTQAELLFSRAYVPILTQLLHALDGRMAPAEFDSVMREVGRGVMEGRARPRGTLGQRVAGASALLDDLGGLTEISEEAGGYIIRSHGCPLAAATADHPEVCNALESLLSEFVGASVTKCCERYNRERCCFEIGVRQPAVRQLQH
jgi:predicted ArsR family transcriptional regulator